MQRTDWGARIGRRVRLRDLHILLTVAEHGTMAKAAVRLNITQPAVSDSIATLETALGVRLLNRSRKGIELTAYGVVLLKYGRLAIDDLRQGIKEIEFLADPTAGELRVGCTESIAHGLLLPVIDRLAARYPRVRLHVHQFAMPPDEFAELDRRRVDLIISRQSLAWTGGSTSRALNVERLFDDRYCLVVSTKNPLARRAKIALADLANERWIMTPGDITAAALDNFPRSDLTGQAAVEQAFIDAGLEVPEFNIVTYSLFLRTRLLASGPYVSIVPVSVLRQYADILRELPVRLRLPRWPVAAVSLKARSTTPVTGLFVECVREVAARLINSDMAKSNGLRGAGRGK